MAEMNQNNYMEKYMNPHVVDKECTVDSATAAGFLRRLVEFTHEAGFNREGYKELIVEICQAYHLSKGASEFYQNAGMEKIGEGDYFCDFDDGHADVVLLRNRIITNSGAVIVSTIYISKDTELPSLQDYYNLDLMLCVITAFISRRLLQRTVEHFVFFDENGYPNIRFFNRQLMILEQKGKLPGMVAVNLDLHNFAITNMEIGRENGDTVIQNYFSMLEEAIGDEGCICRLGGDKFVGVFSEKVKGRIITILSGVPVPYGENEDRRINVSAAAGIYEIPMTSDDFKHDILEAIFIATTVAKRQDEGAIVFYDEKMKETKEHIKGIQRKFREGLQADEFTVYYQPKVDINTKKIVGAEALCRWISRGQVVMPGEFIPILEQTMDICDLDFHVLDIVCKDIRVWLDKGNTAVRASVNLSRKHLVDPDLLSHILKIVDDNGVPHECLEIELTETTTDVQFRDLKRVVNGLKDAGIHVAVDDFGIGYSSLNLIREIPWDVIKIDRCFVPGDNDDEKSLTSLMFRHAVSLIKDMGMDCVVEGVETRKQIELLRENHCSIAQGFYFDKPLPKEEFEARLLQNGY